MAAGRSCPLGGAQCAEYVAASDLAADDNVDVRLVGHSQKNAYDSFAAGWISARNRFVPGASNWLQDWSLEDFLELVQSQCRENPEQQFAFALEELLE